MRATIIFCLSLFFLLLKGNEGAHALAPRLAQGYEFFNENLVVVKVTENPATQRSSITIPANGDIELKQLMTGSNIKYNIRGKLRKATTIKLNAKLTANYDLVVGP